MIEPLCVVVIRSCSSPISVDKSRLITDGGRHAAKQAPTLRSPAWVKRKMLSTNSSTSWPSSSRKYSATVSAVKRHAGTGSWRLVHLAVDQSSSC